MGSTLKKNQLTMEGWVFKSAEFWILESNDNINTFLHFCNFIPFNVFWRDSHSITITPCKPWFFKKWFLQKNLRILTIFVVFYMNLSRLFYVNLSDFFCCPDPKPHILKWIRFQPNKVDPFERLPFYLCPDLQIMIVVKWIRMWLWMVKCKYT